MRITLIFLLLFAGTTQLFAQDKDEELAAQYYASGEFAKSADLYEKLLRKQPSSSYIYSNYLNSLLNLNRFEDAEKMVKNQAKKFPGNFIYLVDLAHVYEKAGEPDKAEKQLKNAVKDLETGNEAANLAQALIRRNKYNLAVETYLKGRKITKDNALFARELTGAYAYLGKKEELISESMMMLNRHPGNMEQIQNILQSVLSDDKDWDLLKKELSVRIQKSPENIEYLEMLMWTMVQQKSFNAAFIQFRALDKRLKENGKRLMDLAIISKENKDYETAVKCYRYVADLGEEKPYYYQAQFGLLNVRYEQITETNSYDSTILAQTEKDYLDFINRYGNFYQVDKAMKQLAELYTFYLHKTDKAMELLQSILKMPRTDPQMKAHTKLHLGDVYLITGDVWEAELLYSQVDKDFKEDALGREAKFRMAKLFFYKGEFERAKAYLDVLKTATTQLISNDAIELGMLIQDNTGFDSTEDALAMYAHAELLIFQNKIEEGLKELQVLQNIHPKHALADEILYIKARAALKENKPELAAKYYNDIITMYAYDILGDNATFALAQLYDYRLNDSEKAQALYEKLMLNYPGSLYVVEARKRFRELRGDKPDVPDKQQLFFNGFTN